MPKFGLEAGQKRERSLAIHATVKNDSDFSTTCIRGTLGPQLMRVNEQVNCSHKNMERTNQ
jgi:hypothetical protein